jgi:hypothetical protein
MDTDLIHLVFVILCAFVPWWPKLGGGFKGRQSLDILVFFF